MNPRILAIIPTLDDDPSETIKSLMNQTVRVSKILVITGTRSLYKKLTSNNSSDILQIFYDKPNLQYLVGKRIAIGINRALSTVNLNDYDYLVRADADAILPQDFIEENMKLDADYVGKAGYAMLLKMSCFLKVFGGRFAEVGVEDSYIGLKLLSQGYSVRTWALPPRLKRKSGIHHTWRYYFTRGIEVYRIGYEPIHVTEFLRNGIKNIFTLLAYYISIIKRTERYDIAGWVFREQWRRIVYGKQRKDRQIR
ncbi:MAG: glycosyltransferase family A protein [Conexivisphaerales archaeon]